MRGNQLPERRDALCQAQTGRTQHAGRAAVVASPPLRIMAQPVRARASAWVRVSPLTLTSPNPNPNPN